MTLGQEAKFCEYHKLVKGYIERSRTMPIVSQVKKKYEKGLRLLDGASSRSLIDRRVMGARFWRDLGPETRLRSVCKPSDFRSSRILNSCSSLSAG